MFKVSFVNIFKWFVPILFLAAPPLPPRSPAAAPPPREAEAPPPREAAVPPPQAASAPLREKDEEETTDDEEESSPASVPQEAAAPLPQAYVDLIINSVREANEKNIESLLNVCQ